MMVVIITQSDNVPTKKIVAVLGNVSRALFNDSMHQLKLFLSGTTQVQLFSARADLYP
jgi:hypothetical protein